MEVETNQVNKNLQSFGFDEAKIPKFDQMAKIELANWDAQHEIELIQNFGFTTATVAQRKSHLETLKP